MLRLSFRNFVLFFPLIVILVFLADYIYYSSDTPLGEIGDLSPAAVTQLALLPTFAAQIDWVDQASMDREMMREGLGENGEGVYLNASQQEDASKLINTNGFNAAVSDLISVHRSINDLRTAKCKWLKYDRTLPSASIIIPFHDEHWSTLLRTIHSLLSRSPASLVKEVILVDDNSTKPFLQKELDEYVKANFRKVRILRTKTRVGLIRARLIGAKAAKGVVLIFIDSHCEAGLNWLPPLLQPIRDHYKTVTCPFIDIINDDDFALQPQDQGGRGAFDWNLDYKRLPLLQDDVDHPERPFASPVMAGGLFAISSDWFWELEGYDEGLEIWGGEQYELSFKIWMCGGRMIDIPCSRIGHVYRKFNPFGVPGIGDYTGKNYKRIAEVWMDEWKNYVYKKNPQRYAKIDAGDLTAQKKLRLKLKCKSFRWFLENVAFDLLKQYPAVEPVDLSNGRIISQADEDICIDSKYGKSGDPLRVDKCITDGNDRINGEQFFRFTWRFDIRPGRRNFCFDYPGSGRTLILFECHGLGGNQRWVYNPRTHQIIHRISQKCIDTKPQRLELFIKTCNSKKTQKWTLENLNKEAVEKDWSQNGI